MYQDIDLYFLQHGLSSLAIGLVDDACKNLQPLIYVAIMRKRNFETR